jgi:hypothetical protein
MQCRALAIAVSRHGGSTPPRARRWRVAARRACAARPRAVRILCLAGVDHRAGPVRRTSRTAPGSPRIPILGECASAAGRRYTSGRERFLSAGRFPHAQITPLPHRHPNYIAPPVPGQIWHSSRIRACYRTLRVRSFKPGDRSAAGHPQLPVSSPRIPAYQQPKWRQTSLGDSPNPTCGSSPAQPCEHESTACSDRGWTPRDSWWLCRRRWYRRW